TCDHLLFPPRPPPILTLFPYTTLFRSKGGALADLSNAPKMVDIIHRQSERLSELVEDLLELSRIDAKQIQLARVPVNLAEAAQRSEEHTSELQSPDHLVCRLLLEKKNK